KVPNFAGVALTPVTPAKSEEEKPYIDSALAPRLPDVHEERLVAPTNLKLAHKPFVATEGTPDQFRPPGSSKTPPKAPWAPLIANYHRLMDQISHLSVRKSQSVQRVRTAA